MMLKPEEIDLYRAETGKGRLFTGVTVRVLLGHIDAQQARIADLELALFAENQKRQEVALVCDQMLVALKAVTYESGGRYFVGRHGDTDVTDEVAAAIAAAELFGNSEQLPDSTTTQLSGNSGQLPAVAVPNGYAQGEEARAMPSAAQRPDDEPNATQWWLASLDKYGNPKLEDGAHSERAGANQALYLINSLNLGAGKKFAVVKVQLFDAVPDSKGVNHEALATLSATQKTEGAR